MIIFKIIMAGIKNERQPRLSINKKDVVLIIGLAQRIEQVLGERQIYSADFQGPPEGPFNIIHNFHYEYNRD